MWIRYSNIIKSTVSLIQNTYLMKSGKQPTLGSNNQTQSHLNGRIYSTISWLEKAIDIESREWRTKVKIRANVPKSSKYDIKMPKCNPKCQCAKIQNRQGAARAVCSHRSSQSQKQPVRQIFGSLSFLFLSESRFTVFSEEMVKERITIKREELTEENRQTGRSYQRKECVREKIKRNEYPAKHLTKGGCWNSLSDSCVALVVRCLASLRLPVYNAPIQSSAEISSIIICSHSSQ